MKSFPFWFAACLLASMLSTNLLGQERLGNDDRSRILLHRQPAAVSAEPSARDTRTSFPSLSHRGDSPGSPGEDAERKSETAPMAGPAITVTASLAIVLGLFAGLVWLTRKCGSRSMSQGAIPHDVLQSLGSTAIDARTRITMVRCGNRILVLAQTATGVHPLSEISEPEEVRNLTAACRGNAKKSFDSALQSLEREKTDKGFLGNAVDPPSPRARGRLFATT